uniref:Uncharacterized protein n=1 Tax=Amphimedon queenslandica TaxID=400682 RepID=A0A1X7UTE5_AMPQE
MAPVFAAFDSVNYRRLLPQHFADCILLPNDVKEAFAQEGFCVSILGNECNSVAIDICHEILINRDLKDAITRPGINAINQVALSIPYKGSNLRNIRNKVFNKEPINNDKISSTDRKIYDNVMAVLNRIKESSLLPTSISEQEQDLLHFRSMVRMILTKICYKHI